MPSATRPLFGEQLRRTGPIQAGETSGRRFQSSASARGGGPIPRLQEVRGQDEQSLGRLLEGGEGRPGQLQRPLVVSLLRLRAGEGHPGRGVRRVQLEDPPEDGTAPAPLSLKRVDLREVQLGAEQAGLQLDGFLEQLGALPRAGPAEGGWRPGPNRPRPASRDRRAPAGPAGRLPRAGPPGPGRPPSGGPRAPGAPNSGRPRGRTAAEGQRRQAGPARRALLRLSRPAAAFAFAGSDAPFQETAGLPGGADTFYVRTATRLPPHQ